MTAAVLTTQDPPIEVTIADLFRDLDGEIESGA